MISRASLGFILIGLGTASGCASGLPDTPRLIGTVSKVVDGDTLDVELSSGRIRVRLYAIDAPERTQPWGSEAGAELTRLVLHREVALEPFAQDRYDRMVARVWAGALDVNEAMIAKGDAWAYRQYMRKADARLCALEFSARKARRGLWGLPLIDQQPPWRWRRKPHPNDGGAPPADSTAEQCVRDIGRALPRL